MKPNFPVIPADEMMRKSDDLRWSKDTNRHFIRCVYFIMRDPIFKDLFTKIAESAGSGEQRRTAR